MKPMPNESSRIIFSEKIMIFKFSIILLCFIAIWTSTRSGFSKISKNTNSELCLSFNTGRRDENFWNFFRETFSINLCQENVSLFIDILNVDLAQSHFENFRFSDFWIFRISLYKFLKEMRMKILKSLFLINFNRLLKSC